MVCLKREKKFLNIWQNRLFLNWGKIGLWGFQIVWFYLFSIWGTFLHLISTGARGDAGEIEDCALRWPSCSSRDKIRSIWKVTIYARQDGFMEALLIGVTCPWVLDLDPDLEMGPGLDISSVVCLSFHYYKAELVLLTFPACEDYWDATCTALSVGHGALSTFPQMSFCFPPFLLCYAPSQGALSSWSPSEILKNGSCARAFFAKEDLPLDLEWAICRLPSQVHRPSLPFRRPLWTAPVGFGQASSGD